jgi:hypothetical protein
VVNTTLVHTFGVEIFIYVSRYLDIQILILLFQSLLSNRINKPITIAKSETSEPRQRMSQIYNINQNYSRGLY